MSPEELAIRGQNYSHSYTTSADHVMELYHRAKTKKYEKLVELGSFKGISTVGLAYAAKANNGFVCAVDLCDEIGNAERVEYWQTIDPPVMSYIFPYKASAMDFLSNHQEEYDFIFHDAAHGNQALPEFHLAWKKLRAGGGLAIHDWEQVTDRDDFMATTGHGDMSHSVDKLGRHLVIFTKA